MKLLILSTPRTGSNALCECLTFSGTLGHVDAFSIGWGEGLAEDASKNSEAWISGHSSPDGHFATKVMWDYLDHIAGHSKGFTPDWLAQFSHVLWLKRRDTIAQAVSWFIALGSGKWTSANERKRDWPQFNYRKIANHKSMIDAYNARTASFLRYSAVSRLAMDYEDMVQNWQRSTASILEFCGLQPVNELRGPDLQKQVNPLKRDYIDRFHEAYGRVILERQTR